MSFLSTLDITGSALTAERFRMDIIAQNIANIDTTNAPDGEPYRRKLTVFQERPLNTFQTSLERAAKRVSAQAAAERADNSGRASFSARGADVRGGVRVAEVIEDQSDFVPVYDPNNPDADEDGYVMMPNVDRAEEIVDLMAATQSYNSNITTLNVIKTMAMKAADLLK